MDKIIDRFVMDPFDPSINFELAVWYFNQKHYAGAVSHFLRCAEYAHTEEPYNRSLIYESLVHIARCFEQLGNRDSVVKGWYNQAISLFPERIEAYVLLSMFYERRKECQDAYTTATIGLAITTEHQSPFLLSVGPCFWWTLLFQKAVNAWWIGRTRESRDLFFDLPNYPLTEEYLDHVQYNLSSLGSGVDPFVRYDQSKFDRLKLQFPGAVSIENNFSQAYQDIFVLSMLNGLDYGFYLEIGSADPFYGSNTALLERLFAWDGVSIEIKEDLVKSFKEQRINPVFCRDATSVNYTKLLEAVNAPKDIGYLQVDCEPPKTTYEILLSIPFEQYRFAVITFEHDYYADAKRKYRDLSRKFLLSHGYILVAGNVAPDHKSSFEDWWVHPDLVKSDVINLFKNTEKDALFVEDLMLKPHSDNEFYSD